MIEQASAVHTEYLKMRADALQPHPNVQRDLNQQRVREIRAHLDLDAIGAIHTVRYTVITDDHPMGITGMWIVDGQHRWHVLVTEGLGEWEVDVLFHPTVQNDAEAAQLAIWLNRRTAHSAFAKFKYCLLAKDPAPVKVVDIVEKHQLTIAKSAGDGHINCVDALLRTYALDEGQSLEKALDVLLAAWGRKAESVEGPLVAGLGLLYNAFNGKIETEALIKKLAKEFGTGSGVIGKAKQYRDGHKGTTLPRCVAEYVRLIYNTGRRGSSKLGKL